MNPTEHAAMLRQTADLMEQSARAVEENDRLRQSNTEATRLASQEATARHYAEEQLGHLAGFMGLKGTTWAHVVSETISLLEQQKRDCDRNATRLGRLLAPLVTPGGTTGLNPDEVVDRAIEKIHRLLDENETLTRNATHESSPGNMSRHHDHPNDGQARLIQSAINKLSEHFDSVLILATAPTADGTGATTLFKNQCGNVHAHEGAVREWLREQESYQNAYFGERGRRDASRNSPPTD